MSLDIDDLLSRAAAAPLGPLRLTSRRDGFDAWRLDVRLAGNDPIDLRASRDAATAGLRLALTVSDATPWQAFFATRSWLTSSEPGRDGGTTIDLWLHGDGLGVNALLAAIADLARLAAADPERNDSAATVEAIDAPPTPQLALAATTTAPQDDGAAEAAAPTSQPLAASISPTPQEDATAPASASMPPATPPRPVVAPPPRAVPWQSFDVMPAPAVQPAPAVEPPPAAEPAVVQDGTLAPVARWGFAAPAADDTASTPPSAPDRANAPTTPSAPTTTPPTFAPTPPAAIEAPKPAGVAGYCRECGSPHGPEHAFCTNCGARLN